MLWGGKLLVENYPPTNKNTLIRALTEEWDKLPQQLLDNVVQNEARRPRLPDSIVQPITAMPLSRMKKPTFTKPHIQVLSRQGIEDCVTVRMPKRQRLSNGGRVRDPPPIVHKADA
ncbi:hypothetical protein TNCV_561511 [Trichonephila clavipes]|uniref:Uncharacterized protein n=1 Tax=Trichonephila clavipes TaxID=2585209 RepID=A0A8X6VF13_TRICX|nr:hypothetical protein TNCV_561511 [Trichonephila clavipes]